METSKLGPGISVKPYAAPATSATTPEPVMSFRERDQGVLRGTTIRPPFGLSRYVRPRCALVHWSVEHPLGGFRSIERTRFRDRAREGAGRRDHALAHRARRGCAPKGVGK